MMSQAEIAADESNPEAAEAKKESLIEWYLPNGKTNAFVMTNSFQV